MNLFYLELSPPKIPNSTFVIGSSPSVSGIWIEGVLHGWGIFNLPEDMYQWLSMYQHIMKLTCIFFGAPQKGICNRICNHANMSKFFRFQGQQRRWRWWKCLNPVRSRSLADDFFFCLREQLHQKDLITWSTADFFAFFTGRKKTQLDFCPPWNDKQKIPSNIYTKTIDFPAETWYFGAWRETFDGVKLRFCDDRCVKVGYPKAFVFGVWFVSPLMFNNSSIFWLKLSMSIILQYRSICHQDCKMRHSSWFYTMMWQFCVCVCDVPLASYMTRWFVFTCENPAQLDQAVHEGQNLMYLIPRRMMDDVSSKDPCTGRRVGPLYLTCWHYFSGSPALDWHYFTFF